MQTRTFINQAITLLMAAMLLMVAGVRSWSVNNGEVQKRSVSGKVIFHDVSQKDQAPASDDGQATVSSLSIDAVITPAISFDFFQYFYFLSQPAWSFIQKEPVAEVAFTESFFLFTCFSRVFGSYIVTNAP
ncbi:hypothetical protein [Dyadobacter sp. NIV53]|uniref:hypothetical protein n=1 Tax=Dyadobacter sp. NIV53 TaxID=2861765 RepID=UPI001E5B8A05|nr:hypothetical protein [Dyadobacter sp. NIV53]